MAEYLDVSVEARIRMNGLAHDTQKWCVSRYFGKCIATRFERMSLSIIDVSLRSALRLMLRKFEMTFVLKDEVLQITTIEQMRRTSIAKKFRIDDLPFAGADIATSLQRILDAKTLPGDAKPVVQFLTDRGDGAGLLLVDANDVALQEVESKLRWLRAKSQPNGR